jgi:hypothetical protein
MYDTVQPLLAGIYTEIQELTKKKPEATLNKSKVAMINRLLVDVQKLLDTEPEAKYLDLLDDEALPQYSDVLLILSQYKAAAKSFHGRYHRYHDGQHQFVTVD